MKLQSAPQLPVPKTLGQTPKPNGPKNPYASYEAAEKDVDKHRVTYETAFNLARGAQYVLEGGARIGQTYQLGSALLGAQAGTLASSVGIVGGTIDVARGASLAQQSAINRNRTGAVLGGLQVAQGLATWVSAGTAFAGGPPIVSAVAAGGALAALAGRLIVGAHAKHKASKPTKAATHPTQPVSVKFDEKAKPKGDGRLLENSFALAKAVSDAASNTGGMAAGWNNVSALFSGNAPTGIWQGLGLVGSTYTILQSASQVAHAAGNQHFNDTAAGTLGLVQGAASLAVSMGVGGHLAPGIAVGAFIAKQVVPMLNLKKKLGASEEGGNDSMLGRLKENLGYAFSGKPEVQENKNLFKSVDEPKEAKKEDDKKADETKKKD